MPRETALRHGRVQRPARRLLLWLPTVLFLGVFFYQPLLRIFGISLDVTGLTSFDHRLTISVLGFTFYQAVLSTILTLLFGLPAAFLFARFDFPGKSFLRTLSAVPFILPTVVVAAGFNAWLGPRGWVNIGLMRILGLETAPITFAGTLGAILLAHIFYNTTIVIRIVGNALSHLDPNLEQAARSLGANPRKTFWRVSLPLLLPPILAAALLVFLFDFTSFGVILLLGGARFSTLEVEIYLQAVQLFNLPLAAWLGLIQLLSTLVFSDLHNRLAKWAAVTTTPRSNLPRRPVSFRQRTYVLTLSLILLVFFALPLLSLPLRSITRLEPDLGERGEVRTGVTTQYYAELFINRTDSVFYIPPWEALRNSLVYAVSTAILAVSLGFPAASALARPGRLERLLDPLLMLPLGASAVTLGLGFILSFGKLITTPLLVPVAHTVIALPFVIRTLQPALASIPDRLRQAAASLGASPKRVWKEVDWPIVSRASLSAVIFAFTISLGEFGATVLLYRPDYPTLPTAIFRFLSQPGGQNFGQAMAMATILMLVTSAGILALERVRLPGASEF